MKLNFKADGIYADSSIADMLIEEFCREYKLMVGDPFVRSYLLTPPGHEKVAEWLVDKGYKAKPYTFGPIRNGEYLAYGIDLDDRCPLVTELKLRSGS